MADKMTPANEAAAFWGVAENEAYPIEERLACALKALEFFGWKFDKEELEADMTPAAEESVLVEANRIINGQRQKDYGTPLESFTRIARLWSIVLDVEITPLQVVQCLIQLKVARAMQGYHRDSYVDIAGYAGCAEKVQDELEGN